jgi:hypothetical protein
MSIPSSTRALLATATIALLSACSGASQLAPSLGANSAASQSQAGSLNAGNTLTADVSPLTVKDFAFASDNGGDAYVYNRSGQGQAPLDTLTTGLHFPYGMFIGAAPNPDLYISNEGDSNILVYGAPSYTTNTFTYNDSGQLPNSVAQCGKGDQDRLQHELRQRDRHRVRPEDGQRLRVVPVQLRRPRRHRRVPCGPRR